VVNSRLHFARNIILVENKRLRSSQPRQAAERCASVSSDRKPKKMKMKIYTITLEQNAIGTTELEKADAPMGVVFGKINFIKIKSGFDFFKEYCEKNKIEFEFYPEDKLILTRNIPNIKIVNEQNIEITGMSSYITGMDNDIFEINIDGIPYPFYEQEFPNHVKEYNEMFN
jgi:hypothetical protein